MSVALLERGTGDLRRQELGRGAAARLPAAVWMGNYGEVHPSCYDFPVSVCVCLSFGVLSPKS
uniref:Uncharacterized protein n=1 Tax=Piliocolobus tephrosceles TaxID=591936 RepID=A0A8C9H6N7_9PRIM